MKRIGNLMPEIATLDNLYLAYYKARRGKHWKQEVLDFERNLQDHLLALQAELVTGKIAVGDYHYFRIYDPKERQICAASFRERVLHHALMNVCHAHFERYQIHDSYACRVGKGSHAAVIRAREFSKKNRYFAKLDVRKYFETIDHNKLKVALARVFKDQTLLQIFYDGIDAYEIEQNKGVPIGNLTSQYFANHFLAQADHFVKETLSAKYYVRYMDDMVLWHNDLKILNAQVKSLENYLLDVLGCTPKQSVISRVKRGLPFLGYVVWHNKLSLAKRSRKRFLRNMKRLTHDLRHNIITERTYQSKILPILAFLLPTNSFLFRKSVLLRLET
ncbi:MAG: hypothetical protein RI894_222 [Bacteroidota bacterium]|jgi:hypothetical protein